MPSQLFTVTLPDAKFGTVPSRLFTATTSPYRVVIRNNSIKDDLVVAHNPEDFNQPLSAVYFIPPLQSETFVLAPKQTIYGMGFGTGQTLSVAASEAIPTKWMES